MPRSRLCRVCGAFHPLDAWPAACAPRDATAPAPAIRPDGMDALRSMADGRLYDSRSAYDASVKRAGCEIVGDDRSGFRGPAPAPDTLGADIRRALEQLRSR
jgi:hypothetical protein